MPDKSKMSSPPPSPREMKADQTTRETKAITASENQSRDERTARLKALRLASEAGAGKIEDDTKPAASKNRTKSKTSKKED